MPKSAFSLFFCSVIPSQRQKKNPKELTSILLTKKLRCLRVLNNSGLSHISSVPKRASRPPSSHTLHTVSLHMPCVVSAEDKMQYYSFVCKLCRSFSSQRDGGSSWNIFFQKNHTRKKIFFTMLQYSLSWVPGYCKRPVRWQLTLDPELASSFMFTSAWFGDSSCAILLLFTKLLYFEKIWSQR